ncbi:MAG TPA: aminopeptidase [Ardenticatenaceae bacterium]|jgi:leucyl aminopeptidase (aminopeptidase T)
MDRVTDQSLMPGARNAVAVCMNVAGADRVWILTDDERLPIGQALAEAAREQGASVTLRRMEEWGPRPFLALPDEMRADLLSTAPTVTLLATSAQPGEIRFRLPFARFLRQELRVRHGHMIGITPALMQTGMLADYHRVAELTFKVKGAMEQARQVRVTSELGTNLLVTLDNPNLRWIAFPGLYHMPGQWGNLPEGETCTTPANVEGIFRAELLGDYFTEKYGPLPSPVTFFIQGGRVERVEHEDDELADEIADYLNNADNGCRIGEFAVGTNEALTQLAGNLLQDEKFPGVHLAFGRPLPEVTNAGWDSDIHVDAISTRCSIWADGTPIMEGGKFLL